ncbi:MAG: PIN domain-containing protein [Planctomycetota bacterium]
MIFVDSGAWFASLIPMDPDHAAASAWLAQNREPLVTTDYIVDETLTLLRVRGQKSRAASFGSNVLAGALAQLHYLTPDEFQEAWEIFRRYDDKDWSFTDCTSKRVIEKLGIAQAFSFDHHFRQFGNVIVVP